MKNVETVWRGKFLEVKKDGRWEYVSRTRGISAAVILAIDGEHVILVEQYRVPLGARCLELPAGLVGDEEEGEEAGKAAIRELEDHKVRAAFLTAIEAARDRSRALAEGMD